MIIGAILLYIYTKGGFVPCRFSTSVTPSAISVDEEAPAQQCGPTLRTDEELRELNMYVKDMLELHSLHYRATRTSVSSQDSDETDENETAFNIYELTQLS